MPPDLIQTGVTANSAILQHNPTDPILCTTVVPLSWPQISFLRPNGLAFFNKAHFNERSVQLKNLKDF